MRIKWSLDLHPYRFIYIVISFYDLFMMSTKKNVLLWQKLIIIIIEEKLLQPFYTFKMKQASKNAQHNCLHIVSNINIIKLIFKPHQKLYSIYYCIIHNIALHYYVRISLFIEIFFMAIMWCIQKILLPLNVQEAMQNARKCNAKAKKTTYIERAKRQRKWNCFDLLSDSAVWFHFDALLYGSILFLIFAFFNFFFGVIVNFFCRFDCFLFVFIFIFDVIWLNVCLWPTRASSLRLFMSVDSYSSVFFVCACIQNKVHYNLCIVWPN